MSDRGWKPKLRYRIFPWLPCRHRWGRWGFCERCGISKRHTEEA
jgi:hypothetical protein